MSNPLHILYFSLISLFWGGSFLAIATAVEYFPPFFSALLRSIIAMLWVGFYLLWRHGKITGSKICLQSIGAGCFTMGFAWVFVFWGEKFVSPAMAAILNATVPIFVTLLTPLMTPLDKLSWKKWAGVLTGFTGVVVIFAPAISPETSSYLKGLLSVMMMSVCYAIGVLWTRRISNRVGNATNLFYQCLGSSLVLLVMTSLFELPRQTIHGSWPALASIFYLGTFSTAIAWLFFFTLIKNVGTVQASATTYCIPLVAIFLDIVVRKQWLQLNQGVGAVIILGAIFILHAKSRRPKLRRQEVPDPAS